MKGQSSDLFEYIVIFNDKRIVTTKNFVEAIETYNSLIPICEQYNKRVKLSGCVDMEDYDMGEYFSMLEYPNYIEY